MNEAKTNEQLEQATETIERVTFSNRTFWFLQTGYSKTPFWKMYRFYSVYVPGSCDPKIIDVTRPIAVLTNSRFEEGAIYTQHDAQHIIEELKRDLGIQLFCKPPSPT